MKTKQLRCAVLLGNAALVLSLLCVIIPFTAQSAPSGGGSATPAGTIYFNYGGPGPLATMNRMNSDGANKAVLLYGQYGEPSRMLHGGHRWFFQHEPIVGETYPDGSQRWELFAIRDDGAWHVQPGRITRRWDGAGETIALLADRQTVATTSTNFLVRMMDWRSGRETFRLPGEGGFAGVIRSLVSISHDGRYLAKWQDALKRTNWMRLIVWDVASGTVVARHDEQLTNTVVPL